MTSKLETALRSIHTEFSDESLALGIIKFDRIDCKAKDIVLNSGNAAKYLYFSEKSLSRCYYLDDEGLEQTLWIKPESTFITEYKSFVSQEPSQFSLQLYEDSQVYRISRASLMHLYQTNQDWALFGIKLTEHLHTVLIDVFVNLLANDATRNYQYIEYAFPRFIQVAPLKDIASMLQVSPVTLSRIRAGKQTIPNH